MTTGRLDASSDLGRVVGDAVTEVSIAAIMACGSKYGFDGATAIQELGLDQLSAKLSLQASATTSATTTTGLLPAPTAPPQVVRPPVPPVSSRDPLSAHFIAPYSKAWSARIEKIKLMRAAQRELVEKGLENRHSFDFTVKGDERKSNKDFNISDMRTPTAAASKARRRDDGTRGLLTELTRTILGTAAPRPRASLHTPLSHNTPVGKHQQQGPRAMALQPWLPSGPSLTQGGDSHLDSATVCSRSPHRKTNRAGVRQLTLRRRIQADERRLARYASPARLRSASARPRSAPVAETPFVRGFDEGAEWGEEGKEDVEDVEVEEGEGGESCLLPSQLRLFGLPAASSEPSPSQAPRPAPSPLRLAPTGRNRQIVVTCTVAGAEAGRGAAQGREGLWERHGVVALQASCSRIDLLRALCSQLHLRMHVGTSQLSRPSHKDKDKSGFTPAAEPVIHDVVLVFERGYGLTEARQSLRQQTIPDPPRLASVCHILVYTHDGLKLPKDIST